MTEQEHERREQELIDLIRELYELAPHTNTAHSPSQARRLESLYERVREVLE
jgi:hypothetical protein